MTFLLAVLISGVLLDSKDMPMPKYPLAIVSADGKLISVTTDKNGKFRADLAPGTYRVQLVLDGTVESITVDKSISKLKLHRPLPPGVIETPKPPEPHVIEVIRGSQGDVILPKGPRG
jgi:hypothetical protein